MTTALHSVLDPVGPQAGLIERLWWLMLWTAAVVFVLVVAFMVLALVRSDRKREPADVPASERRARAAVGAAAVVSAVVLVGLLVASVTTGRGLAATPQDDLLRVEVIGRQWWWEVRYPGAMPSLDASTANEIHLPVGRPVLLKLEARDVIHSFWVPNLHGKRDLIPGHPNALFLEVDQPGVYAGVCAEFCGLQHAHMGFRVVARPAGEFDAWLEAQRQPARPPADALQAHGQQVFLGTPCAMCHAILGTPAWGRNGPDLTHLASRPHLAAGTLPNTPETLADWITDPHRFKPGAKMPPTALEPADLQALVAYLGALQ